jgi:hypothetical protein
VKLNEFKKNAWGFFLLFFFIGLLNNNTYVVINTGAQDLAEKFGKKNLMGAFQMYARLIKVFDDVQQHGPDHQ